MKGIRVDPATGTVRVEGGCTWGDVDHATHPFGLAVPAGTIATTGVAGLTLGEGIGHLSRWYGLTLDNLLAVDLVLADGSPVTASADDNADLFWALRGGGGNFGIVSSFQFQAHPVHTVYAGPTFWDLEKTPAVMRWYREFPPEAPEELSGFFAFLKVPPADPFPEAIRTRSVCGVVWCYTGPAENAERAFAPIRAFGPPLFEHVGPIPYPVMQRMFDPLYPPGLQWYWPADFVNELSNAAIDLHAEHAAKLPTLHSTAHFYPIDGAVHRVGSWDTAWSYRDTGWAEVIVGVDPDPANAELVRRWTVDYWEALHPHSAGGAYVNFMMDEGQEWVQATYRDNYARLVEIKDRYDPRTCSTSIRTSGRRSRRPNSGRHQLSGSCNEVAEIKKN